MSIHRWTHRDNIEIAGNKYENRLHSLPSYFIGTPEFLAGIEQPDRSSFTLNNKDLAITNLKRLTRLRGKPVVIKEIIEDLDTGATEEFVNYVGLVTSSPTAHLSTINLRYKNYDFLNNLFPGPDWELNATNYPAILEAEAGNYANFIIGTGRKVPLYLIEAFEDVTGDRYRYHVAYGDVTVNNVYRDNLVLREYSGTVSSVTSTTAVLSAAQADKPDGFFVNMYVWVGSTIRKITNYVAASRTITFAPSWSGIANGSAFTIKQWKKNLTTVAGHQFTEIEFAVRQKIDNQTLTSARMRADVTGLQTEKNPAYCIKTIAVLMGQSVNTMAFDDAATAITNIGGLELGGGITGRRTLLSIFDEVSIIGRMLLRVNENKELYPVMVQTPDSIFGQYDTKLNVARVDAPREQEFDALWRSLSLKYRVFRDTGEFRLTTAKRTVFSEGVEDKEIPFELIDNKITADMVCNFMTEAKRARDVETPIVVGQEARGRENLDLIKYRDALLDDNGTYMIVGRGREGVEFALSIIPNPEDLNVYSPLAYPADSVSDSSADFRNTPPLAVTGVGVSWTIEVLNLSSRALLSWTNPTDGNFEKVRVEYKKSSETVYKIIGETSSTEIYTSLLAAGQQYNFRFTSINQYKVEGGVVVATSTASGDTTAPVKPATPTGVVHGRSITWSITPNPETDIQDYTWEVRTSAGTLVKTYYKQGTTITHVTSGTGATTLKARVLARDYTPNSSILSDYSANIDLDTYDTGHISDGAVTTPKLPDGAITNPKLGSLAVGSANIQSLAVQTAKINDLAVTNLKAGNSAIDENKRIDIYSYPATGLGTFSCSPSQKITGTVSISHGLGRKVLATLRISVNLATNIRLITSVYVQSNGTSTLVARWEIGNFGGDGTITGIVPTFEAWYW